jgi:hypothetical protein
LRTYIVFFVLLFFQLAKGQRIERELLFGKIVSDSMDVENITIFNISSKNAVLSDFNGKFSIKAKPTDTLYFQSVSFISKHYILTKNDFKNEVFEIQLYVKVNELNEVIVSPYTLTGNLFVDSQKIKVIELDLKGIDLGSSMSYEDDRYYKSPQNSVLPNHFAPNGATINFNFIVKGIGNWLGVKNNSSLIYEQRRLKNIQSKSYSEHIKERFSNQFLNQTLKIESEQIVLFLAFSEPSLYELAELLKPQNELKLTNYLVQKAKEFNTKNSKEILSLPNEK